MAGFGQQRTFATFNNMKISKIEAITVVSVEPFSPTDESASVTLSSGSGEIVAFCWPCNLSVGDVIENRLYTLEGHARASYLSDWLPDDVEALSFERLERTGNYSYKGRARVVDESEGLVEVHGFVLEFPDLSCDGHVDFEIVRLDVRSKLLSKNGHKKM